MAGLEKILQKIEADATGSCEQILAEAKAESDRIFAAARIEGEGLRKEFIEKSIKEDQNALRLAHSQVESDRKKALLVTKTGIVNETIDRALQKLKSLPVDEYFSLMMDLVKQYSLPGEGTLRFAKKDLERLPKDFEMNLNKALNDQSKTIVVSPEAIAIDGGVVIQYKDIEQNCTLNSLFDVNLDAIKDRLYEQLFVENSL